MRNENIVEAVDKRIPYHHLEGGDIFVHDDKAYIRLSQSSGAASLTRGVVKCFLDGERVSLKNKAKIYLEGNDE